MMTTMMTTTATSLSLMLGGRGRIQETRKIILSGKIMTGVTGRTTKTRKMMEGGTTQSKVGRMSGRRRLPGKDPRNGRRIYDNHTHSALSCQAQYYTKLPSRTSRPGGDAMCRTRKSFHSQPSCLFWSCSNGRLCFWSTHGSAYLLAN